jgi:superoxide dismutase, Fe-Mn family
MNLTRRQFTLLGLTSVFGALMGSRIGLAQTASPKFVLPPLGYAFEALEPHIDAQTMMLHHDKHHAAAVAGLNTILEKYQTDKTLVQMLSDLSAIPAEFRTAVRNNAGSHYNHSLFWDIMTPGGAKAPFGALQGAIDFAFGSADKLVEVMSAAATTRFGSGWAWLVVRQGKLEVISTANQDTPLELGATPILGIDVWEHAYYLKYQNKRADYIKAWWNVVNWNKVAARYTAAK